MGINLMRPRTARTPFERVVAQRPAPDVLGNYERSFGRPLEIAWSTATIARYDINDGDVEFELGPELGRSDGQIRYLCYIHSTYEGGFAAILDIRRGPATGDDAGSCELGPVMHYVMEWYEHGADFVALRDAGVRLSWEAAQWLYAVGREELDDIHAGGKAVSPGRRSIRLGLFHKPYTESRKRPGRYLGTNAASSGEIEWPRVFAFIGRTARTESLRVSDRAALAFAVGGLTQHSDPAIDRLLHDPDAGPVLRDLLLERGAAVEPLLRDRADATALDALPLADHGSIDDELRTLWHRVIALDPMMDTSDPHVFELPGTPT